MSTQCYDPCNEVTRIGEFHYHSEPLRTPLYLTRDPILENRDARRVRLSNGANSIGTKLTKI